MSDAELKLPPEIELKSADPDAAFRVVGEKAFLWFEPRNDTLIVAFDNLATLDHPYPRLPWLYNSVGPLGYSILGVQSSKKDWFREKAAPDMLRQLASSGFFRRFSSVTLIGASMGAFAALNFAPLIPGSRVLAFSPQSTMNTDIAPFEKRFPWAVRNSNWSEPDFLDAKVAVPFINRASVVFDPLVAEDKAHALRLTAPHIQLVKLAHSTHEAVRVVVKSGAMHATLQEFVATGQLGPQFWQAMRNRRVVRKWCRAFIENVEAAGHDKRTLKAAEALLKQDDYYFAAKAKRQVLEKNPTLAQSTLVPGR